MTSHISCDSENLILLLFRFNFLLETSDSIPELAVFGGVDERVHTAVGEHQDHREVVEPTREVDRITVKIEKEHDFVCRPTYGESAAYHQRCYQSVAPSRVHCRTRSNLYAYAMLMTTLLTLLNNYCFA